MSALRDYQLRTVDAIRAVLLQGARRVCVVMPTGAGKTLTHSEIARLRVERGGRVLWLAHRAELVDQAVAALEKLGLRPGCLSASAASEPRPFSPVQVATVQTLISRNLRPEADLIVADEAHHYVAASFGALLRDYPSATALGPTATPERSDGLGLGGMFDRLVVGVRVRELIDAGHLVAPTIIAPREPLKSGEIAQRPVDAYLAHARGRRAICFSRSVKAGLEHMDEFRALGVPAAFIDGTTPGAERREHLEALRAGRIRVLVNVYVATEGFDVPAVDCVILARGYGSAGPYIQSVGRALRPSPGKADAIILDLIGTSHVHGSPEEDREYSLDGRGIRRATDAAGQTYCRVCGAPIEPGATCADCGTGPREEEAQRVVGAELVKYARKRQEGTDERVATLARWLLAARAKGHKEGSALHRYKAVYGAYPPGSILVAARAMTRPAPTVAA